MGETMAEGEKQNPKLAEQNLLTLLTIIWRWLQAVISLKFVYLPANNCNETKDVNLLDKYFETKIKYHSIYSKRN